MTLVKRVRLHGPSNPTNRQSVTGYHVLILSELTPSPLLRLPNECQVSRRHPSPTSMGRVLKRTLGWEQTKGKDEESNGWFKEDPREGMI